MNRSSRNLTTAALAALAGCAFAVPARAQVPFQISQAQSNANLRKLQQPGGPAAPSLSPSSDADLGQTNLLEGGAPRWQYFNLNLDSQYYYTNNAYLTDTAKKGTGLLVNTLDFSASAEPLELFEGKFFGRAGYQTQWFNYGIGGPGEHFGHLDFDANTVYLDGREELSDGWVVTANLSYTRLLSLEDDYNEFYKELVPTIGVGKQWQLSDKATFSIDYTGNYRFTDEPPFPGQSRGANDRTDQALALMLSWQLTPKLSLQPFYRFQYSYYPDFFEDHAQHELLNTLGLSVYYAFNSWSSVRLFVNYEAMHASSPEVPDFHKLDAGGGLSLALKF